MAAQNLLLLNNFWNSYPGWVVQCPKLVLDFLVNNNIIWEVVKMRSGAP